MTLLLTVSDSPPPPPKRQPRLTPPPSAKRPFGAVATARFPATTVLFSVRLPALLQIPAPSASLAVPAEPTVLSLTIELSRVSDPHESMPPPNAGENGHCPSKPGQGMPESILAVGSTLLPVMTLSETVSVAPTKDASGGTSIPPPAAHRPSSPKIAVDPGLVWAMPPVMVTPRIETVGSLEARTSPIVSTLVVNPSASTPPPLMIVALGPAPTICTLTSTVTPP